MLFFSSKFTEDNTDQIQTELKSLVSQSLTEKKKKGKKKQKKKKKNMFFKKSTLFHWS